MLTLVMTVIWAIVTARLIALVSYISFNFFLTAVPDTVTFIL
jgi:hypothetical protein